MSKVIKLIFLFTPFLIYSQYGKTELKRTIRPKAAPMYRAETKSPIRGGVDVDVLEYENNYWLIKYDTIIGWTTMNDLYSTSAMYKKIKEAEEAEAKAENEDKRERVLELWGEEYVDGIMNGFTWIGMTKEMLIESKGYPDDRNTTQTANGFHEQWIYGKDISNRTYIYLDNRVVTTIQK